MNILLFETSERVHDGVLRVRGRRARYLSEVQQVVVGEVLRVGELNGNIGTAEILSITAEEVCLKIIALESSCAQSLVTLIVALPRPQMVKRILETASTMGVQSVHFIRSERVIKSFFSSPVLEEKSIRQHLLLGLEQGVSTNLPRVSVHKRFRPFIEDELPAIVAGSPIRLLAHTTASADISELGLMSSIGPSTNVALAIGPEGGWQAHETPAFEEAGFVACGLGERILRVETAVVSLLGQIELLRKLDKRENV